MADRCEVLLELAKEKIKKEWITYWASVADKPLSYEIAVDLINHQDVYDTFITDVIENYNEESLELIVCSDLVGESILEMVVKESIDDKKYHERFGDDVQPLFAYVYDAEQKVMRDIYEELRENGLLYEQETIAGTLKKS